MSVRPQVSVGAVYFFVFKLFPIFGAIIDKVVKSSGLKDLVLDNDICNSVTCQKQQGEETSS
jgi:hypothetical protein